MLFKSVLYQNVNGVPSYSIRPFLETSASGKLKIRKLCIPNQSLRQMHRNLLAHLRTQADFFTDLVHGGVPNRSAITYIATHFAEKRQPRFLFVLDLRNAFHSVDILQLAEYLTTKRIFDDASQKDWHSFLTDYASNYGKGLAEGFSTSPDLFNFYCSIRLDAELQAISRHFGLVYTRYLDDLLFSSLQPIGKRLRRNIFKAVAEAGFEVNHRKVRVLDLTKGPVRICGVGIQPSGRLFQPRERSRRLYQSLTAKNRRNPEEVNEIRSLWSGFAAMISFPMTAFERRINRLYVRWSRIA